MSDTLCVKIWKGDAMHKITTKERDLERAAPNGEQQLRI
jgi:hypothetical protein